MILFCQTFCKICVIYSKSTSVLPLSFLLSSHIFTSHLFNIHDDIIVHGLRIFTSLHSNSGSFIVLWFFSCCWKVTILEVAAKARKSDTKAAVLGQAVVDLVPALQGKCVWVKKLNKKMYVCTLWFKVMTGSQNLFGNCRDFLSESMTSLFFCLQVSVAFHPLSPFIQYPAPQKSSW